ncbi:hypothetical protein [Desulfocurvibacter africanus]|uniref:hypothetical protein n=1 Tax=Desulfocurvibacter africanus TaxID=873 RepID=UPI000414C6F2|nr:hypothetical protein [Desulfocurvibacter africanus]
MLTHPDEAYSRIQRIFDHYKDVDFNEADTRIKLIDSVLKECLGWKEDDISREEHNESGFIDYRIHADGVSRIIIEAKKTGDYFEVPISFNSRRYKISASISSVKNLIKAIRQARSYCDDIGCKFGCVTNGKQYVIFSAISVGRPWIDGDCIVFNSLRDIIDNFNLFWNLLSKDSIINGLLGEYLEKGKSDLKFQKVIDLLHNPDEAWLRNQLYTYIQPIADFAFNEMIDEARAEILKECYIEERTRHTQKNIDSYFRDKLPHFAEQYAIMDADCPEGREGFFNSVAYSKSPASQGGIVVLLGGVGAGKSTFIHRYYRFILSGYEKFLWFYMDFRTNVPSGAEVEAFIFDNIYKKWEQDYSKKLNELFILPKIPDDKHALKDYFGNVFNMLKKHGYTISVVFDNIDQHSTELQEHIFLYSSHLSSFFKAIVLVSMRENTFLTSTREGVFDAFNVPKFHISSPNFINLILKRLNFAIDFLRSGDYNYIIHTMPKDKLDDVIDYFSILKESFTSKNKQSEKLINFINNISVGNMREALRMFTNFIISGHTNITEVLHKKRIQGAYQIAFHQMIKSVLLGDRRYYDQDRSNILNVYDFDPSISDSHSNILRLLSYLYEKRYSQNKIGRGYISINELFSVAESALITRRVISDCLIRMASYNLIEFDNLSKSSIEKASYAKITHCGIFYLTDLCHQFAYLDLVSIDTPIHDFELVKSIYADVGDTSLKNRIARANDFVVYLKESEEQEFKRHPELTFNEFAKNRFLLNAFNVFSLQQARIMDNNNRRERKNEELGLPIAKKFKQRNYRRRYR